MTGLLPDRDQLPPEDVRAGPQARRLRHGRHPLRERRAGHRDRLADQPRPRERPVHRDRRHQGLAPVAAGRAEHDDPSAATASRTRIYTRDPNAPFMTECGQGRLPAAQRPSRGVLRGLRQRLPLRLRRDDPARRRARSSSRSNTIYPNVNDGVEGMYFIQQMRRQQQGERRLAAAEAQAGEESGGTA